MKAQPELISRDEVVELLAVITACDHRKVGEADVTAWTATLQHAGVTSLTDAMAAVVAHYATETAWLMPAHVARLVTATRRDRAAALPSNGDLMADVDPDNPDWLRTLQERRRRILDGEPAQMVAPAAYAALRGHRASLRSVSAGTVA